MPYKAIFVTGPESSGTRLMTRLFMEVGCFGDDTHKQQLDKFYKQPNSVHWPTNDVVFRRSVPHDGKWYSPIEIARCFEKRGFEFLTVITIREHFANILSKVENNHSRKETAEEDMQKQISFILQAYHSTPYPFCIVSTSLLFKYPYFMLKNLYKWTGFNIRISDERIQEIASTVYDADAKYME